MRLYEMDIESYQAIQLKISIKNPGQNGLPRVTKQFPDQLMCNDCCVISYAYE
ncbi:hypothetical protein HFA01_21670 [Halobacillus faecis]|uniref:Uncharacterized protein n=1 Tax=Halobacillus faecis TaxID=360184 RepID=A0A511WRY8_9BACI|nr:hypothetical protein HFA01_21670 [Halobacillus faecis]